MAVLRYLLFLLPLWGSGQEAIIFDDAFRFQDGLYLSHASLLANTPDVPWAEVAGEMVQLAEDYRVQIDAFGYKSREYVTPYAIALDGLPYIFVRAVEKRNYHEFAGLRNRGTYSTMRYDTVVHAKLLMKAYNPTNGLAFREGYVDRDQQRSLARVMDLRTGRRYPLDRPTVMRLVAEEADLVAALERTDVEATEKIVRALQLYNSRHPLRLPLVQNR